VVERCWKFGLFDCFLPSWRAKWFYLFHIIYLAHDIAISLVRAAEVIPDLTCHSAKLACQHSRLGMKADFSAPLGKFTSLRGKLFDR